jgi:hypothetical protein
MPPDWSGWQDDTPGLDRFGYLMAHSNDASGMRFTPTALHGCDSDYVKRGNVGDLDCRTTRTTATSALTLSWQVGSANATTAERSGCLDRETVPRRAVPELMRSDGGTPQTLVVAWTTCRIGLDRATSSIQLTQVGSGSAAPPLTEAVAGQVAGLAFRYLVDDGNETSPHVTSLSADEIQSSGRPWSEVVGVEVCLLMKTPVPMSAPTRQTTCEIDAVTGAPLERQGDGRSLVRAVRSVVVLRSRVRASTAAAT